MNDFLSYDQSKTDLKLVIALQYYHGDYVQAMRLARMIGQIQKTKREDIEFVFVRRFDAERPDEETIREIRTKFCTHMHTTSTPWTGWPGGPNGMALGFLRSMATIAHQIRDDCGVLMIEPDCVPLCRSWLDKLMDGWVGALKHEKWLMGAWRPSGGAYGHINGNGIFRPDLAKLISLDSIVGPDLAWDCAIAPYVKDRWQETNLIRNLFQAKTVTEEHLVGRWIGDKMPVLAHGVKDDSGYEIAKRILAL